jgi:hypothetical protein
MTNSRDQILRERQKIRNEETLKRTQNQIVRRKIVRTKYLVSVHPHLTIYRTLNLAVLSFGRTLNIIVIATYHSVELLTAGYFTNHSVKPLATG